MIDPLSVAGLALAILDQLIKLSERTAELVSDIKVFDEVVECHLRTIILVHSIVA
jgi:hypothetical protein